MKSMKKLVSLALCTAMLGSAIPGMSIAAAETTGKTEFWNDKMANTDQSKLDQMQESIKDLSGIDVELIAYPDTASYQTAMHPHRGCSGIIYLVERLSAGDSGKRRPCRRYD